ncbi:hypothetical protein NXV13_10150 [Bacteroides ovatus]|nr:hypothetical protein [Bacteroides ovatus]
MVRELYQRLREYFNNLPEPTEEERQFIRELNAGYFPITSVHRDDLEGQGFDVEKISDDDMQNLAEKMVDDYCEQLFYQHGNHCRRNPEFPESKNKRHYLSEMQFGKYPL